MKKAIVLLAACLASHLLFANHWVSENPGNYQMVMALNGVIQINGEEQASDQLEVGAFCNGECRGSQIASLFPYTGRFIIMLSIDGDNGDQITFKLYDHSLEQELDLASPDAVTFDNDGLGTLMNPYVLNFTGETTQTFSLNITGYGISEGGYYLIAPPFDSVNPAEIEGMTSGNFDLYYFDQQWIGEEWRNYEAEPFNLESGKGYLYAHETDVTLTFTGEPYSGNGQVALSKTEGVPLEGWNLVGNPFAQTATIDRDCYVMNTEGTEIIAGRNRTVNSMQGIFVIAATDGETMVFTSQSTSDEGSNIVVNVMQGRNASTRSAAIDRAIVRFEGNGTLPKLMLNPENTRIYVTEEGTDYAVIGRSADNATPISFKASHNGTYTLSFDIVNLDLDYLHLFDNIAGAEVDLLQSPIYTFEAFTSDNAERFKLVYATTTGLAEGESSFAYYANGEIRLFEVEEGTSLQIVDMKGRLVLSCDGDAMNRISTSGMASGVYMLRLIKGDDMRVQKIIIK